LWLLLLLVLSKLQVRLLSKQLCQGLLDSFFCFGGCADSCAGVADDFTAQGKALAQELQLRTVLLLGVGSHARSSRLCKTGQAEIRIEAFGKLLTLFRFL